MFSNWLFFSEGNHLILRKHWLSFFRTKSATRNPLCKNVRCYALRYWGQERSLQAPGSDSACRLCLQVLPAPFHQGKSSPRPSWERKKTLPTSSMEDCVRGAINVLYHSILLGLQSHDSRAQPSWRRHLHLRGLRQNLQATGQLETAQVTINIRTIPQVDIIRNLFTAVDIFFLSLSLSFGLFVNLIHENTYRRSKRGACIYHLWSKHTHTHT